MLRKEFIDTAAMLSSDDFNLRRFAFIEDWICVEDILPYTARR